MQPPGGRACYVERTAQHVPRPEVGVCSACLGRSRVPIVSGGHTGAVRGVDGDAWRG